MHSSLDNHSARHSQKREMAQIPHITGLKLNVDGSAIDLNSAVGGCIRESAGLIVLAFSCNFGQGNNMEAEAKALLQGFS